MLLEVCKEVSDCSRIESIRKRTVVELDSIIDSFVAHCVGLIQVLCGGCRVCGGELV